MRCVPQRSAAPTRLRHLAPAAFKNGSKLPARGQLPAEGKLSAGTSSPAAGTRSLEDIYAKVEAQGLEIVELRGRVKNLGGRVKKLGGQVKNLQPAGDRVLLDVAAQVLKSLLYVGRCHIGPATSKGKVFYTSTSTAFMQLNKQFQKKGTVEPTFEKLAGPGRVEEFCKSADALLDARNQRVHPPNVTELDAAVEGALKLATPEAKARSSALARACFVLKEYKATIRPAIEAALNSEALKSASK
ncbi:hypothetical protein HYH03_010353 [Edaphochlamys debaryana]|uniref:Uncharacterized protein n=1 Tax=Edaphochlamys debaryana TaxID=47281 RepID=A0A835XWZ7_9CHLO|nr:hypothetical protein HYH03_010353 [Edaphochlamys debaryana]|eukprot:KAG2491354.1 hypothetical protein HYH03_010353 [Edaphochlamys debaryana]